MSITDHPVRPVFYRLLIYLADDEWGNKLMTQLADEALADPRYAACQPLVVAVYEHGGWWLEFALLDGSTTEVASANDLAVFHGAAQAFREQYCNGSVTMVGGIRREASTHELLEAQHGPAPPGGEASSFGSRVGRQGITETAPLVQRRES
jgi:hypothetical protein